LMLKKPTFKEAGRKKRLKVGGRKRLGCGTVNDRKKNRKADNDEKGQRPIRGVEGGNGITETWNLPKGHKK